MAKEASHKVLGGPDQDPEKVQEPCTDTHLDPGFVDRLKVATATAIIRQKPASMSGKEYAKQLAGRLKEKEESWKAKAKALELELLKTKQELFLAQTKTTTPLNINESNTHTDQNDEEPAFLTPPSSSEDYHHIDHKMALSRNTNFLHSLSTLSTLSQKESDLKSIEKSSEVIFQSVKSTVDYITDKLKGESSCHLLSPRMLQEAADAILKSLDSKIPAGCMEDVVALVSKLVENLLDEMMGNSKICSTNSQRESCCILLRLSKSSHLLPPILSAILERIEKVSTSLRNIRHHGNPLDVQLLENSFFLFSVMEDILVSVQTAWMGASSSSKKSCKSSKIQLRSSKENSSQFGRTPSCVNRPVCDDDINTPNQDTTAKGKSSRAKTGSQARKLTLHQGFRTNIQQRLEDSLLHISHDFPLYAQYVWRLTGILEMMNQ